MASCTKQTDTPHETVGFLLLHLETQFLEEVTRSSSLLLAGNLTLIQVSFLEYLLQILLNLHLLLAHEQVRLVDGLLQVHIDLIPGGEYMPDVDVLDEGLHRLGTFFDLLLGHAARHATRTACDPGHETVRETLIVGISLFHVLNDHGLFTGMTTGQDDDYLARFNNCHDLFCSV